MKAISTYGQSIFDIAISKYGSVEGIVFLMGDNSLGLDDVLVPGTSLEFDKVKNVVNKEPVAKFVPVNPKSKMIVEGGQSMFDIALKNGSGIELIFDLLTDNPDAISSLDAVIAVGSMLKVNPVANTPEPVFRYKPANYSDITSFIITGGQNLFDLALQLPGSVQGLFDLLDKNTLSLDDFLSAGQVINHDNLKTINKAVSNYYSSRNMRVNSGYMEYNFWITELGDFVIDVDSSKVYVK